MDYPDSAALVYRFDVGVTPDLTDMRGWMCLVLDGVIPDVVEDAQLLATELVSNAVDHARSGGSLCVRRCNGGSVVRLEIDDGRPDLDLKLGGESPAGGRGRGLLLVDAISCRWGVARDDDRKTVWADIAA